MFKPGDKIVCVKEPTNNKYIKYGEMFTVEYCDKNTTMSQYLLTLYELPGLSFPQYRFKSLSKFRKEKIQKIDNV